MCDIWAGNCLSLVNARLDAPRRVKAPTLGLPVHQEYDFQVTDQLLLSDKLNRLLAVHTSMPKWIHSCREGGIVFRWSSFL